MSDERKSETANPSWADLVTRLRAGECGDPCRVMDSKSGCLCAEAADEIALLHSGPIVTLNHDHYLGGLRFEAGAYRITRIEGESHDVEF